MSRLPTISADPEHSPQSPPFGSIDNNGGAAKEAPLEKPGTSNRPDTTQVNGSPAAALDNVRSAITLKNAAWGKAVDGLEPGFLLNTPGLPNQVVPFNTQISYQVLVRNTSGQDRTFTVHCKDFSEMDPYLIPGGEIHKALGGSKIPENYHAIGVIEEVKWFPAYIVKLAPGETVVVPNELGLYVGSADKQNFPRIEQVKMGMNWIVQPIAIHRLTAAELVQTDGSKTNVTIVDRGGKTVQRSVPSVIAKSGGKQFYAKIRLELTPGRTTAQTKPAVDDGIAWGREWNGLQLGLRLPKGVRTFSALSQARFEVVLHNRSDKPTQLSWMGYPTIEQFSPELFTPDGKPINFNLTIAGPYVQQATKLAAGETVALGTISLPQDLRTVLDSLPAGPYLTSGPPPPSSYQAAFSLDVTLPNGKKDIVHTSHIKFTVQRPDIASRGSARRENHSIIPAVANPQADNRPVTVNPNPPSSRSSKSVDLSYKPGARALRDRTLAGQSQSVNAVAFSPDSRRVVTGSADGTAIVWEVTTGRRLLTLSSRTAAISSAIYAPSGKIIITGCADGAIHIWDTATGNRLATIIRYRVGAVRALDISADGTKIGCGYENGAVCVWAASSGKKLAEFDYNNRLLSVAIANDGKLIAAGYTDATLKAWDIQTQQSVFSTKNPQSEGVTGLHFDTQGYLYTFDREETLYHEETHSGKWKVSSMTIRGFRGLEKAGEIKGIINFQIPDGVISQSVQTIPDGVISQSAQAMSYDDMKMVFGLSEGQAAFNNMTGGQVTLNAHEGPVAAVAISPDGAWVATGGRRNGRGEAKIWDIKAHKPIKMAK